MYNTAHQGSPRQMSEDTTKIAHTQVKTKKDLHIPQKMRTFVADFSVQFKRTVFLSQYFI
jgi:hypothetical protein